MGHDVVTVIDAGRAGQTLTDKAVLQLAGADQRAVVTLNRRHFVRLHAAEPNQILLLQPSELNPYLHQLIFVVFHLHGIDVRAEFTSARPRTCCGGRAISNAPASSK